MTWRIWLFATSSLAPVAADDAIAFAEAGVICTAGAAGAASTSRRKMRPCGPLPVSPSSAMPLFAAMRRANGVAKIRLLVSATLVCATAGVSFTKAGVLAGVLAGVSAGAAGASSAAAVTGVAEIVSTASPASAKIAITVPTATFSLPASTRICATTPSSIDSTSMVALSVSISAITSPECTVSPTAISHFATVPSVIVGESAGMVTFTDMAYPLNPSHTACAVATISSTCGSASFSRFSA